MTQCMHKRLDSVLPRWHGKEWLNLLKSMSIQSKACGVGDFLAVQGLFLASGAGVVLGKVVWWVVRMRPCVISLYVTV